MTKADLQEILKMGDGSSVTVHLACGNTLTLERSCGAHGYHVTARDISPFACCWDGNWDVEEELFHNLRFFVFEEALPALAHIMKALAQKHKKVVAECKTT